MTCNDTLRRLRYALNINDGEVARIISLTGRKTTTNEVSGWLKQMDEPGFMELSGELFCRFLDGLIIEKRGPHPDGTVPKPLAFVPYNEVLKKLRIALQLRDDEMIAVFKRVDFTVTKAELGSFFRRPEHRNYRKCPEQVLRKFLTGLSTKA